MLCWQHGVLLRSFQEARESVESERIRLTLHKKCPLGSEIDYGRIDIEKGVRYRMRERIDNHYLLIKIMDHDVISFKNLK